MQKIIQKLKNKIILLSIMFGITFWIIDSIIDYLIFYEHESYWDLLLFNIPSHEQYIRSIMIFLFLLFGVIISFTFNQLQKEKEKILKVQKSLKFISNCNQELIHAKEESEFVKKICNVIFKSGYPLSWIRIVNNEKECVQQVEQVGF